VLRMKMIQIRNVPDEVHRTLKMRAAAEGLSLSGYLLREIERYADRPTVEEVLARIKRDGSVTLVEDSATAVRAERDAR
jgi:plasmid stability protein